VAPRLLPLPLFLQPLPITYPALTRLTTVSFSFHSPKIKIQFKQQCIFIQGTYPYIQLSEATVSAGVYHMQNSLLATVAPAYSVQFSDLNERLFACLLSNFSCQLVENFLVKNSTSRSLASTGFIRKKKSDKSFQFFNIVKNETTSPVSSPMRHDLNKPVKSNLLNLNVEKVSFKLCLKLDKWPLSYQQGFFNRKRIKYVNKLF
jgi:hypothetical protein